ncbi:MAG: carbohydrate-binding domain-containing protein, partial [Bacteroidaceae bacterium]|nr:carbohydrate-binding domain-containing protein [Bacteroidaceae bacterium]
MKKIKRILLLAVLAVMVNGQWSMVKGQCLNVRVGSVTYKFPAAQTGDMTYSGGQTLTIINKVFTIADISAIYIDDSEVVDNLVSLVYSDGSVSIDVAGNVAQYVDPSVEGAHVSMAQSTDVSDDNVGEITYALSGESSDGEFYLSGSYKSTVELRGLTLTNKSATFSGAAVHVQNGKRIDISVKSGTVNTLTDCADGSQKAALYVKGHAELKGKGTLNVNGLCAHGVKAGDYLTLRNCTLNVRSAVKDGISCNEYFLQESGEISITSTGDDGLQVDLDGTESTGQTADHEDEDSGNVYLLGGTLTVSATADAVKGVKAAGDIVLSGATVTVSQTGGILVADDDISYPTSLKADGNISVTGGTLTITNTAKGGKGLSAEGNITIDESSATTLIDITANGSGGTAETSGSGDGDDTTSSYRVYVSLPTTGGMGPGGGMGGSSAWKTVYLYKSDGTLVQQLTNTV